MINWKSIESQKDLEQVKSRSNEVPCLIFKHSTRCNISSMAKYRLEEDWKFSEEKIEPYYLDLISYKALSNAIADDYKVHHESPQVLLIKNGECTYDASHLDITVEELEECYED